MQTRQQELQTFFLKTHVGISFLFFFSFELRKWGERRGDRKDGRKTSEEDAKSEVETLEAP